jgi:hypothetical protein
MTVRLPNGAIFSIASTYGTAKPVTAATNAKPPVLTAVAHGLADAALVEVASGWTSLDGRVARVDGATEDTFDLEGLDTTDTKRFPVGSGIGSVREITAWTQISQVLESGGSGGEQQFYNYSFLEDVGDERQIPTTRSARSVTLTIADDDTLPHYPVLKAASDDREPRAIRFQLPSGAFILFRAYVSMTDMPSTTKNEAMTQTVTLSLTGQPTRYSGAQA